MRSLRQFRHYLLGHKFLLRTDYNCFVWLMSFKNPEGQLARWLEELSQFDFQIVYRQGKKHGNADGLSQIPLSEVPCDCLLQELSWNHCLATHVIIVPRFILNGRDSKKMLMMLFHNLLRIQLVV